MKVDTNNRYDKNSYYDSDGKASRLSPSLNGILYVLDLLKAWTFIRKLKIRNELKTSLLTPQGKPEKLQILDVGAGDGKFLFFMQKFGFEPHGTTLSLTSQAAAKTKYNVSLEYSESISTVFSKNQFNVITYWHVFEHLEKPKEHVAAWRELLAPGGQIMIEVPNVESLGAKLSFHSWLGSDILHHINHMTYQEIESLIVENGFKILRREGFSLKFSYPFLWSALLGKIFGEKIYSFDSIFNLLKSPFSSLKSNFFVSLNGILAIFYLFPIIIPLIILEFILNRGEVLKLYIEKS